MAYLHRCVTLDDNGHSTVFTFQVATSFVLEHRSEVLSREFSCSFQRWNIRLTRDHRHIGAFLTLLNVSPGMCVTLDLELSVLNRQHFSRHETTKHPECIFTYENNTHGRRNLLGLTDLWGRDFLQDSESFLVEFRISNVVTKFHQILLLPRLPKDQRGRSSLSEQPRLETDHFAFAGHEWNLGLFPQGETVNAPTALYVTRQTSLDLPCCVAFQLAFGRDAKTYRTPRYERILDTSGVGARVELPEEISLYSLASRKLELPMTVHMLRATALVDVELRVLSRSKSQVHLYDRDKQAWLIEPTINNEKLAFKLYYADRNNVPRGYLRIVNFNVWLLPSSKSLRPVAGIASPYSVHYSQKELDDGFTVQTDFNISQLSVANNGIMNQENTSLVVRVEWISSNLIYNDKFCTNDEIVFRHKHQMWKEIVALQTENLALEKQLYNYQQSIGGPGNNLAPSMVGAHVFRETPVSDVTPHDADDTYSQHSSDPPDRHQGRTNREALSEAQLLQNAEAQRMHRSISSGLAQTGRNHVLGRTSSVHSTSPTPSRTNLVAGSGNQDIENKTYKEFPAAALPTSSSSTPKHRVNLSGLAKVKSSCARVPNIPPVDTAAFDENGFYKHSFEAGDITWIETAARRSEGRDSHKKAEATHYDSRGHENRGLGDREQGSGEHEDRGRGDKEQGGKGREDRARDDRARDDRARDDRARDDRARDNRAREDKARDDKASEERARAERRREEKGRGERGREEKGRGERGREEKGREERGREERGRDLVGRRMKIRDGREDRQYSTKEFRKIDAPRSPASPNNGISGGRPTGGPAAMKTSRDRFLNDIQRTIANSTHEAQFQSQSVDRHVLAEDVWSGNDGGRRNRCQSPANSAGSRRRTEALNRTNQLSRDPAARRLVETAQYAAVPAIRVVRSQPEQLYTQYRSPREPSGGNSCYAYDQQIYTEEYNNLRSNYAPDVSPGDVHGDNSWNYNDYTHPQCSSETDVEQEASRLHSDKRAYTQIMNSNMRKWGKDQHPSIYNSYAYDPS